LKRYIYKLKSKTSNNKILIQNFSYLSALQVFNLLIPLITYPYLIRVLGKETYGLVVFAQAIIGYLNILVGFGFDISAVKDISINRNNPVKLSEIISNILILKFILFLVSLIILIVLIHFIPQAPKYRALFYITMLMSISTVIYPSWYFQGIEQMKYITYINLISRLIFVALIFVFIHSPEDYLLMPLTSGVGAILAGLISLYIIFALHKIRFNFQPLKMLNSYLKESVPLFVSNVSIILYAGTNKVIIGAFIGMAEVAYYDLGEKIVSMLKIPQSILSQTLFPKINKDKNIFFVKKLFWYSISVNIILFLLTVLFSEEIILLLGGKEMIPGITVVRLLSITVPIIAASNIFAIQLLIPFHKEKEVVRIVISSVIFYLAAIIFIITIGKFSIINISIITVFVELWVTVYSFVKCKKYKLF
jgi:O-antigen/teichoic acid export membrane protein